MSVETFTMKREEAESKYKNGVNSTYIYDKIPVPAKIQELSIVHIPDWTINCCGGNHVNFTGEVKHIKIQRINLREAKKELEFVIEVTGITPYMSLVFINLKVTQLLTYLKLLKQQ
jgi:Ser-tRNA(Ala) deacylase AlaX